MKVDLEQATGGKDAILADLLDHPLISMSQTVGEQVVLAVTPEVAQKRAKAFFHEIARNVITNSYDMFVMMNGERPNEAGEWDDDLDAYIAEAFDQYAGMVSMSWFGEYIADNRIYEGEEQIERLAASFAKDAWRCLMWVPGDQPGEGRQRTNNQMLAACGVVISDIQAALSNRKREEINQMDLNARIGEVLDKISTHFLMTQQPADADFMDLLDGASDSDDGIALGAAGNLGLDAEDVRVLRTKRVHLGEKVAQWLREQYAVKHEGASPSDLPMIEDGVPLDGEIIPPVTVAAYKEITPAPVVDVPMGAAYMEPDELASLWGTPSAAPEPAPTAAAPAPASPSLPVPTAPAEPAPKKTRAKRSGGPAPAGAIPIEIFQLMREHSAVREVEAAGGLAVSRTTYNNYVTGKAHLIASEEQKRFLVETLRKHRDGLNKALTMMGEL